MKPTKAQRVYLRHLAEKGVRIYEPPAHERHYCRSEWLNIRRSTVHQLRDGGWIEVDLVNPFGETFWRITTSGREQIA